MIPRWSRRRFLAHSALAVLFASSQPLAAAQRYLPWRNWSGGLVCHPKGRFSPSSEASLSEFLASLGHPSRGCGALLFTLVPTDGHLVVLDQLSGLLGHDPRTLEATLCRYPLRDMGVAASRGSGDAEFAGYRPPNSRWGHGNGNPWDGYWFYLPLGLRAAAQAGDAPWRGPRRRPRPRAF